MTQQRKPLAKPLASLAAVLLAGCAPSGISSVEIPANVRVYASQVPKVRNSKKFPCWHQREIARQQAFLESTIEGQVVVRQVACGDKRKIKADAANETS